MRWPRFCRGLSRPVAGPTPDRRCHARHRRPTDAAARAARAARSSHASGTRAPRPAGPSRGQEWRRAGPPAPLARGFRPAVRPPSGPAPHGAPAETAAATCAAVGVRVRAEPGSAALGWPAPSRSRPAWRANRDGGCSARAMVCAGVRGRGRGRGTQRRRRRAVHPFAPAARAPRGKRCREGGRVRRADRGGRDVSPARAWRRARGPARGVIASARDPGTARGPAAGPAPAIPIAVYARAPRHCRGLLASDGRAHAACL